MQILPVWLQDSTNRIKNQHNKTSDSNNLQNEGDYRNNIKFSIILFIFRGPYPIKRVEFHQGLIKRSRLKPAGLRCIGLFGNVLFTCTRDFDHIINYLHIVLVWIRRSNNAKTVLIKQHKRRNKRWYWGDLSELNDGSFLRLDSEGLIGIRRSHEALTRNYQETDLYDYQGV